MVPFDEFLSESGWYAPAIIITMGDTFCNQGDPLMILIAHLRALVPTRAKRAIIISQRDTIWDGNHPQRKTGTFVALNFIGFSQKGSLLRI